MDNKKKDGKGANQQKGTPRAKSVGPQGKGNDGGKKKDTGGKGGTKGNKKQDGKNKGDRGRSRSQSVGKTKNRPPTPEDIKALKVQRDEEGKGMCFTDLRTGKCSMDKACKYSHALVFSKDEKTKLVEHLDKSRSSSPNPKAAATPCVHWQQGRCYYPDGGCPYKH